MTTPRPSAAFTLIELLTVIAIIGILAAIIIPTVGKVRESAKRSKSLSNLRQIAVAMNLHAGENRGKYPLQGGGTGFDSPLWPARLLPYLSPKIGTGKIYHDSTTVDMQNPVLLDPMVADGKHHSASDYGANASVIRSENDGAIDASTIAQPSRLVLVTPTATNADPTKATWYLGKGYTGGTASQSPSDRGNPGTIMCGFADGHVATLKLADLATNTDKLSYFHPNP
ncbi:prepilin-type N-terminal cleavage/methylation domain-containing protein [Opitutaceae bacterium TAV1]|nr:prepilin-type N-terminal cleavage/methylation domain-containing protein [Opitutaceae bacterium TAV1]